MVKDIAKETFLLTSEIDNKEIVDNLIDFIKKNKNTELSNKTHVKGHFTGFHKLVNNVYFHNFLKLIIDRIYIIYKNDFNITEAWGNILKKGDLVTEHDHGNNAFCGILYLSEGGPGTFFKQYNKTIEEKIGRFVLFHPSLLHSVEKIEKDIERITVAFNMSGIKPWDKLENITFIK